MKIEELLQPRWKVIADYPNNGHDLGDIINIYQEKNSVTDQQRAFFNKYPHLFKPLQWWEDRAAEDMPEYVKDGKFILKVRYKMAHDGMIYRSTLGNTWHFVHEFSNIVIPSTESEYLNRKEKLERSVATTAK